SLPPQAVHILHFFLESNVSFILFDSTPPQVETAIGGVSCFSFLILYRLRRCIFPFFPSCTAAGGVSFILFDSTPPQVETAIGGVSCFSFLILYRLRRCIFPFFPSCTAAGGVSFLCPLLSFSYSLPPQAVHILHFFLESNVSFILFDSTPPQVETAIGGVSCFSFLILYRLRRCIFPFFPSCTAAGGVSFLCPLLSFSYSLPPQAVHILHFFLESNVSFILFDSTPPQVETAIGGVSCFSFLILYRLRRCIFPFFPSCTAAGGVSFLCPLLSFSYSLPPQAVHILHFFLESNVSFILFDSTPPQVETAIGG
ncbi:hypothetical protein BDR26DRAFT_920771, partial [Obelidium mucronatum]